MDSITALVTIVQLIGLYRQEADSQKNLSSDAFMRWLEAHHHNELKDILFNASYLQEQVNILLRQDHHHIISQLDKLSELTLSIAKQFDGLAPIAFAAPSDRRLPTQAIELLRAIIEHNGTGFQLIPAMGGFIIALLPSGTTGQSPEPNFLEEDCDQLVQLGYLRTRITSNGNTQYLITRNGVEFAKMLPNEM